MRILCTGSAGYLGSRLAKVLEDREHDVIRTDHEDADLRYPGQTNLVVGESGADIVVHLAANPGRVFGEENPAHTVMTNTVATINVAKACASIDATLVYVSTSEVYGTACGVTTIEDTPLGRPLNLYGATKRWGEEAAALYAGDLVVIRPSMPYGPGMATGVGRAALPSMIAALMHGEPYTVHVGTQRSWCYVDDLVRGMADIVERGRGVYNVGRDDDLRDMENVANLVCYTLGLDNALIQVGVSDSSITPIKDISMARLRSLGWRPTVDLVEGIKRTAESLR